MKKFFFIAALALVTLSSCKKQETPEMDDSMATDSTMIQQDTTTMVKDTVMKDSTVVDSSDVELLNKMSTKNTTKEVDPSKGKYALSETKWKLVELNGKAVKNTTGKEFYINLDSKTGTFAAFAGCNKISGSYFMKAETKLGFSKVTSTKMSCPSIATETRFIDALAKVDNYMIEGTMLHFHKAKTAVAKFSAVK